MRRYGMTLLLLGSLLASWLIGLAGGAGWVQVMPVVGTVTGLVFLWERLSPHRPDWTPSRRRLTLDLVHTALSSGLTSRLVELTLLAAIASAVTRLRPSGLWPSELPLLFDLAIALLLGELGAYWTHRLCHLTRTGWRVHAVHHSAEAMHLFASGRTHPLNTVLVFSAQSLGLVLLGAPDQVVTLMAVFTGVNGILQHANIDAEPGWLRWWVSTNVHHRLHHSVEPTPGNSNFGNNLIVWDRVFGTVYEPVDSKVEQVGLAGTVIPETLAAHWATPWRLDRYEQS